MSKFKENDEVWIETGDLGVVKSVEAVRGVGAVYSVRLITEIKFWFVNRICLFKI